MSIVPFKGQKYSALKKQAVSTGQPFQDPEFGHNEKSLFFDASRAAGIEWKRPQVMQPIDSALNFFRVHLCCDSANVFVTLCTTSKYTS